MHFGGEGTKCIHGLGRNTSGSTVLQSLRGSSHGTNGQMLSVRLVARRGWCQILCCSFLQANKHCSTTGYGIMFLSEVLLGINCGMKIWVFEADWKEEFFLVFFNFLSWTLLIWWKSMLLASNLSDFIKFNSSWTLPVGWSLWILLLRLLSVFTNLLTFLSEPERHGNRVHRHISILIFHLSLAKPPICRFIECEAPTSQPILLKDVALRESSGNWAPKKLSGKVAKITVCFVQI